ILLWNYTTNNNTDVLCTKLFQFFYYLRNKSFVPGRKRGNSQNVYIIFYRLFCHFFRSLKKRSYIHIETHVCKSRCHYFGTTVVSVLAHFGDHYSWSSPFRFIKFLS